MPVKIVTDSAADIPQAIMEDLGIAVVPQHLIFGDKSYRDRIDISEDEFYDKLVNGKIQPTTAQPTPQDFSSAYVEAGRNADGIVSIHISSRLSGTFKSAEQGSKLAGLSCPIEVVDSKQVTMAHGLIVIAAARMAAAGKNTGEIAEAARNMVSRTKLMAMFDTLVYLARGGRIGKAKSLIGSLLNVKPVLTLNDGEFVPLAQFRNKAKAKDKLREYIESHADIEEISVIYSTDREEAVELAASIGDRPQRHIIIARVGPALGAHAGPGLLAVAVRKKSDV